MQLHLVVRHRPKVASVTLTSEVLDKLEDLHWAGECTRLADIATDFIRAFLPSAHVEIERLRIVE